MKFNFYKLLFIFIFVNNLIFANDGSLDPSFGTGGKVTTSFIGAVSASANSVIQQADGLLVAAGSAGSLIGNNFAIARYQTDGSPDSSFGTGGQTTLSFGFALNSASSVVQQSTGKLIVAGTTSTQASPQASSFAITRLNTDGTQDLTFGTGGSTLTTFSGNTTNQGNGMALLSGDGFVVVGTTSSPNAIPTPVNNSFAIATYDLNGILQNQTTIDFGDPLGNSVAKAVFVQQDGKIVVAGYSTPSAITPSCQELFAVARLNSDLTPDATFGSGGLVTFCFNAPGSTNNAQALSVTIQQDGKIVIAGENTNNNALPFPTSQFAVARLTTNGNLDTTFNGTGQILFDFGTTNAGAASVVIQRNNQRIVLGGFTSVSESSQFALARLITTGTLDPEFGTNGEVITIFGGNSFINSTVIQIDDKIVAAGGSDQSFGLTRYLVDTSTFVTITSPTNGEVINNAQPLITGTMEVGNTIVTVSLDGGAQQSATTINSGAGTWSFLPSGPLSQGAHTVQAFTTDPDGNTASTPVINFIIDSSTFVTITSPTNGETIRITSPVVTGTMEPGNTIVTVSIDGGAQQSATTINSGAGTWSFSSGPLTQGMHTVQAFTTDPSGNTASTRVITFTIQLTPMCIFPADMLTLAIRNKYVASA